MAMNSTTRVVYESALDRPKPDTALRSMEVT